MTEIKQRNPTELSEDIHVITAEIHSFMYLEAEAKFEIGRRLKYVKEKDMAHGQWSDWCKSKAGITQGTARRYIRVFDRFNSKRARVHDLSLGVLYELITFTDEEIEQEYELPSGEVKKPTEMSRREIEQLKKDLKAEQEARKQAERQAESAQERERLANEKAEQLEEKEPEVRVETRTEYIERIPDDYEDLKRKSQESQESDGPVRIVDEDSRKDFYREFAEDLRYIVSKYGSITYEGDGVRKAATEDSDLGSKIDAFDDFWISFSKAVLSDGQKTIIEMESV